jgi:hypothetical protein
MVGRLQNHKMKCCFACFVKNNVRRSLLHKQDLLMSSLKQEDYNLHLKQHTPNPKTSTHQIGLIFRSFFRPVNPTQPEDTFVRTLNLLWLLNTLFQLKKKSFLMKLKETFLQEILKIESQQDSCG